MRQRASPAVDVLGGNPKAAQNVAGVSPQHAPQPVTAAPRPVPPFTKPSSVPFLDGKSSPFVNTEKSPLFALFDKPPVEGEGHSETGLAVEGFANIAGVLSTSSTGDCKSSEMQRLSTSYCPPLSSEIQLSNTVQELQNMSKSNEEKSPSNIQSNQIQPTTEVGGLVDFQGTQEKTSVTLENEPETGVKKHMGENVILQPPIFFKYSTLDSQTSVETKVQDAAEIRAMERSEVPITKAAEQEGGEQNSQSCLLSVPLFHKNESKQTDLSQTKISSSEPNSTSETEAVNIQDIHQPHKGEQVDTSMSHGLLLDCAATMQSESFSIQDTFSKPSSAPLLVGTDLVVSLQTEQVVEAGTCPSDHVNSTELPLIAQIVHSADAHEIVVVREDGDWSGVHLNQSYLLQREDGTVCQAAIINNLSTELSAGETVHLDSQSVEVYEFCDLVEEVAEETVCGTSGIQIPHSPGYEVNLFNALLDHSDDYSVREDHDSHIDASFHAVDESDSVIISQQAMLSSHGANQIVACSNNHTLSLQNSSVATVEQHLILDASQAVANTNEVCLVEVAAVTSDSFTVEHACTSAEVVNSCTQVIATVPGQTEVSVSVMNQKAPQKREAEVTASPVELVSGGDVLLHGVHVETQPSIKQSSGVTVVSATKPEECVSSHEETKKTPTTEAPLQTIQTVVVTTETETVCSFPFSGKINPKLLILKPGASPILKQPASSLAQVSKEQNAHSTCTVSEECLSHTISAADLKITSVAPHSQNDQANCSVKTSETTFLTASDTSTTPQSKPHRETLTEISLVSQNIDSTDVPDVVVSPSEKNNIAVTDPSFNDTIISQPDSLVDEEEDEDMEPDEALEETEEGTPGQGSSAEEGSDEDNDPDKTEGDLASPSSSHKVLFYFIFIGAIEVVLNLSNVVLKKCLLLQPAITFVGSWHDILCGFVICFHACSSAYIFI